MTASKERSRGTQARGVAADERHVAGRSARRSGEPRPAHAFGEVDPSEVDVREKFRHWTSWVPDHPCRALPLPGGRRRRGLSQTGNRFRQDPRATGVGNARTASGSSMTKAGSGSRGSGSGEKISRKKWAKVRGAAGSRSPV